MDDARNDELAPLIWLAVFALIALLMGVEPWLTAAAQSFSEAWDLETEGRLAA